MCGPLGLIKRVDGTLSDFAPPDSPMAKDVEAFARETHPQNLLFHGYRTYYFASFLGRYHRVDADKELLFAAAMLHDIGLTESNATPLPQCCFALSGAKQARDFLRGKQHSEGKVRIVAEAISVHLNLRVPEHEHGPVASLLTRGAVCDVFSFEHRRMTPDSIRRLRKAYPPGTLTQGLNTIGSQSAPNSRLGLYNRVLGALPDAHWLNEAKWGAAGGG